MWKVRATVLSAFFLASCSGAQLTYNTVEVATTVQDLYVRQALSNLSRTIDEPSALPSQMDIQTGTITTSNNFTPSATFPLASALTQASTLSPLGLVTSASRSTTLAGAGGSISGGQTWQQNWNVLPLSDANTLRNLRALYRFAVYKSDVQTEYKVPRVVKGDKLMPDFYFTQYPQCILCTDKKLINPKLRGGWLYWTSSNGVPAHMPPEGTPTIDLGRYGNHELYMTADDYLNGYLSEFVLFLLPNAEPGAQGAAGANGRVSGAPNRPNFGFPPAPVPPIANPNP
jgi:hypothetical protein